MSDMPRCATCKHWDRLNPDDRMWRYGTEAADFGRCEVLRDAIDADFQHESSWVPIPNVHKTFGCVLHEPRAEE
jgi:hypothetical protein